MLICHHRNSQAQVSVSRAWTGAKEGEGDLHLVAEIRVVCMDCKQPAAFSGVPTGHGVPFDAPMAGPGGLVLKAPIIFGRRAHA